MQFDNSQTTLASATGRASAITDAPPTTQAQGPGLSWSLVRKNSASLPGSLGIDKTCDQALALVETGVQYAGSVASRVAANVRPLTRTDSDGRAMRLVKSSFAGVGISKTF